MSAFEYPIEVGDIVVHLRDQNWRGIVVELDKNIPHPTTCRVVWDGDTESDIQWTNKLVRCGI